MKCDSCRKRKATRKDYRTDPETGTTGKYLVCDECFNLNDYHFFKNILG